MPDFDKNVFYTTAMDRTIDVVTTNTSVCVYIIVITDDFTIST